MTGFPSNVDFFLFNFRNGLCLLVFVLFHRLESWMVLDFEPLLGCEELWWSFFINIFQIGFV